MQHEYIHIHTYIYEPYVYAGVSVSMVPNVSIEDMTVYVYQI